jgi:hypothetical protein
MACMETMTTSQLSCETIDPVPRVPPEATASARAAYDEAYRRLIEAIRSDLEAGATVTDVAEAATWSREYINQIRDGKAGDTPPKRRTTDRRSAPPAS